jgi:hypothetical protein
VDDDSAKHANAAKLHIGHYGSVKVKLRLNYSNTILQLSFGLKVKSKLSSVLWRSRKAASLRRRSKSRSECRVSSSETSVASRSLGAIGSAWAWRRLLDHRNNALSLCRPQQGSAVIRDSDSSRQPLKGNVLQQAASGRGFVGLLDKRIFIDHRASQKCYLCARFGPEQLERSCKWGVMLRRIFADFGGFVFPSDPRNGALAAVKC